MVSSRAQSPAVSCPIFVLCVVSIAIAIHGVAKLAQSFSKPVYVPDPATVNSQYCEWRMHEACWASPNMSLATYELLFPVTRETLFQQGITEGFQPLETRYDVAVVWNAMSRCREMHQRANELSSEQQATLYKSLPSNASVDAWCGASLLHANDSGEPRTVVWMFPADAMHSPFTAHERVFLEEATERDGHERAATFVQGLVALSLSLTIFFSRRQVVPWLDRFRAKAAVHSLVPNPRAVIREVVAPKPEVERKDAGEPTWIDLTQTPE